MADEIVRNFKSYVNAGKLESCQDYVQTLREEYDALPWDYIYEKVYLHACLRSLLKGLCRNRVVVYILYLFILQLRLNEVIHFRRNLQPREDYLGTSTAAAVHLEPTLHQ